MNETWYDEIDGLRNALIQRIPIWLASIGVCETEYKILEKDCFGWVYLTLRQKTVAMKITIKHAKTTGYISTNKNNPTNPRNLKTYVYLDNPAELFLYECKLKIFELFATDEMYAKFCLEYIGGVTVSKINPENIHCYNNFGCFYIDIMSLSGYIGCSYYTIKNPLCRKYIEILYNENEFKKTIYRLSHKMRKM